MKYKLLTFNLQLTTLVLLVVSYVLPVKAQVTAGSLLPPLKGSLLDLKESDQPDGSANSIKGMMMSRVFLKEIDGLSPILDSSDPDYEVLKPQYTGLMVYNVNTTPPLEKGLYVWDGTVWKQIPSAYLLAENGLYLVGSDTVLLGGDLNKLTGINFGDYNLIFNRNQGNIAIEANEAHAILDIENPDSVDPLILQGVKFVSDADASDNENAVYYKLEISEKGVLRKDKSIPLMHDNSAFVYTLRGDTPLPTASVQPTGYTEVNTTGEVSLKWIKGDNTIAQPTVYNYIELPEEGSYAFSFRFYGPYEPATSSTINTSGAFYLNTVKNGVVDNRTEMVISRMGSRLTRADRLVATYTLNITVTGEAGDHIEFSMGAIPGSGITIWQLRERPLWRADRTSMFFWRL